MDDEDASEPSRLGQGFRFRRGKRILSSAASQTDDDDFFTKKFVLLQSCYGIQSLWNLHLISYDDGELIVLYRPVLFDFGSFRCGAFVFVLKLKWIPISNSSWLAVTLNSRLLKRVQWCCNVLPYLSSVRASHNHIMLRSPLEIVAFTSS